MNITSIHTPTPIQIREQRKLQQIQRRSLVYLAQMTKHKSIIEPLHCEDCESEAK